MGRPAGSKNKPKGCTTISHCLESQVRAQDEDHLELENHNLLSIIIQINLPPTESSQIWLPLKRGIDFF